MSNFGEATAGRTRVGVLISGRGSNMAALLYASRLPDCPYEIVAVAANDPDAAGLALAHAEGVPVWAESHRGAGPRRLRREADGGAGGSRRRNARSRRLYAHPVAGLHHPLVRPHRQHPPLAAAEIQGSRHPRPRPRRRRHAGRLHRARSDRGSRRRSPSSPGFRSRSGRRTPPRRWPSASVSPNTSSIRARSPISSRANAAPIICSAASAPLAMTLPEAEERPSHGSPGFRVRGGKYFAYFSQHHHGDERIAVLVLTSGPGRAGGARRGRPRTLPRPPLLRRVGLDRRPRGRRPRRLGFHRRTPAAKLAPRRAQAPDEADGRGG